MHRFDKERFGEFEVISLSLNDLLYNLLHFMYYENISKPLVVACLNPHSYVMAKKIELFKLALNSFDILLPDGIGLVLSAGFLGKSKIKKRIAGPDFFFEFTSLLNKENKGISYFFLGSTQETLNKIKIKMEALFPNIKIAGSYSPPYVKEIFFPSNIEKDMVDVVNERSPNVLWVGFTAPKQEIWIYRNIDKLHNVKFIGAIGAAFDFFAGTKKRSPKIFRTLGFEWLPRFFMEPKRLWKRNFVSTPLFLYYVIKEKFGRTY